MPTYESLLPRLQAQDDGLAVLVALVAIGCFALTALQRRRIPRTFYLPLPSLSFILLIGLLLRLPLLGESLWYDEAFTARIATLPLDALPAAVAADVHPPGYYSLVWLWAHLIGSSALALRLPSLVFGLLSIYLVYRLVLAYGRPENEARLAALLLAMLPSAVYYADEARSYTLLLCLVLGALLALARDRQWVFFGLLALIPWVHNLGAFYVAFIILSAIVQRRWWWPSGMGFLVGALWLPLAVLQSSTIADGYWTYITLPHTLRALVTMTVGMVGSPLQVAVTWVPMLAAIFLAGWRWLRSGRIHWPVVAVVVGVPSAITAVSFLWHPIFVPRVVFVSMCLLVIPLAAGLRQSRFLVALTALALVSGLAVRYVDQSQARVDYRAMAAYYCTGADYLYTTSIPAAFIFSANSSLPLLTWKSSEDDAGTFVSADLPLFGFEIAGRPRSGEACIAQVDTPLHAQSERDYVVQLLNAYRKTTVPEAFKIDEFNYVYFYRINVP
jgi:hypothetical protein